MPRIKQCTDKYVADGFRKEDLLLWQERRKTTESISNS